MADRQPILSVVMLALDEPLDPTGHLAACSCPAGLLAAPLPMGTAQNAPVSPRSNNPLAKHTGGSPNCGRALLSRKRVVAEIRSPTRVSTMSPGVGDRRLRVAR
jgi:hypothetical protein